MQAEFGMEGMSDDDDFVVEKKRAGKTSSQGKKASQESKPSSQASKPSSQGKGKGGVKGKK